MKLSARNQIEGTIVEVVRGPVSVFVKLDVGNGQHITATLTAEAADELGLAEGGKATAIFKASSVIIGV
jgi:molybdopterin-binding protein